MNKEKMYTVPQIAKLRLLWYKNIDSVRKFVLNWELESVNVSNGQRPTYFIKESSIIKFLHKRASKLSKKQK